MYVIGLTGGVGSGKSYVAGRLKELCHAELLIADELGHIVMEPGTEGYQKIIARFGENIKKASGELDRKKLADIIFHDEQALADMNAIIHPQVRKYLEQYIRDRREQDGIIFLETAIMYESGCDILCDEIWYVSVPAVVRIERLKKDRGYTQEKAESIIQKQKSDTFFLDRADRVIDNGADKETLEQTLKRICRDTRGLAGD